MMTETVGALIAIDNNTIRKFNIQILLIIDAGAGAQRSSRLATLGAPPPNLDLI